MNLYHSQILHRVVSRRALIVVLVLAAVEVTRLHSTPLARRARQGARALAIDTPRDFPLSASKLHRDVPRTHAEAAHLRARSFTREARLVILPLLRAFHLRLVEDRHADPDCDACHAHTDCEYRILVKLQCAHHQALPAPR